MDRSCYKFLSFLVVLLLASLNLLVSLSKARISNNRYRITSKSIRYTRPATKLSHITFTERSTKVGVICYVPFTPNTYYVIQFTTMLFSSWKYVTSHPLLAIQSKLENVPTPNDLVVVDLLVWCAPSACKLLPPDCRLYQVGRLRYSFEPECYFFPKPESPDAQIYSWINSFIFATDAIFSKLLPKYDYFLRLDTDTFLAPPILTYAPTTDVVISHAHYCSQFAEGRLEDIAANQLISNQKVHNIASSWYAKSNLTQQISELVIRLTMHLNLNEFDPKLPGLNEMFNDNKDGIWPTWWRPVSLLYGSELALNAVVGNFSKCCWTEGLLDQSTCNPTNIMKVVQLHSYQTACQFRKFDFLDSMIHIRDSRTLDPRLFMYHSDRDVRNMTLRDYAIFIAWHGASNYVEHIQAWVKSAISESFVDIG